MTTPANLKMLTMLVAAVCSFPSMASSSTEPAPIDATVSSNLEPPNPVLCRSSMTDCPRGPDKGSLPPLELRLPRSTAATPGAHASLSTRAERGNNAIRFKPVPTLVEWGIKGSTEALVECRKGAFPGAVVASYQVWTPQSNAQPDHCDRF
ncbi:hypothetical protein [Mitsuaria sp. GD03876]|uniref:hypothetical protein n=1 Tax=Mitsuaria sp. GD03876 TaxID=2975399 RepID=UPI00244AD7F5|nr:hypothetical protein [Mitsuaria sp. GD03876]MDH0867546.1 hypothetical protein [Mitsuaria sp. GD03876]